MEYRFATVDDIEAVSELQKKYHVSTVSDEDRPDGFVTTLFTPEQFKSIIEEENGLAIACDKGRVVAYAMSASWKYWSAWPMFAFMIKDLPSVTYLGKQLSEDNSFQYGPVCVDKAYRGKGVVQNIFEFSRREFKKRFPIMITFINKTNPRSFKAHTEKAGFEVIKSFEYNNNNYYELGYDMEKPVEKADI
ncbi:MAG: GNAT family acetyltransferase [Treponema sp.]|nr:MAG: GNAT family acetyltransferase [Treponema sp.]